MSKSKSYMSIDVQFIFVQVFAWQMSKTCNNFAARHAVSMNLSLESLDEMDAYQISNWTAPFSRLGPKLLRTCHVATVNSNGC